MVIPTPRQLHPERYGTDLTTVAVEIDGDATPRPEGPRESNAWNWKLAVFSALPILAGLGLLLLGLVPEAVVLRW